VSITFSRASSRVRPWLIALADRSRNLRERRQHPAVAGVLEMHCQAQLLAHAHHDRTASDVGYGSIAPRGTTQVHRWPVTAAIWSKPPS